MRTTAWIVAGAAWAMAACASSPPAASPVGVDPNEDGSGSGSAGRGSGSAGSGSAGSGSGTGSVDIPRVTCAAAPDAGPAGGFRHLSSEITAALGDANHRGIDLVASASTDPQVLEGDLAYGTFDKSLEDEDVDVFACKAGAWTKLGTARTDDSGHFTLSLSADDRLDIALRDVYLSVVGDRTGVGMLAFVAPDGASLAVSDVDGTLTSSEDAFAETIALGIDIADQPDAPAALTAIAAKGYQPVYLTARGRAYTTITRSWLAEKGFPVGPLRLAPDLFTLPGQETIDFKTGALAALAAAGVDIAVGIGNRATDVDAYTTTGVPAAQIWMKLPEYSDELAPDLAAGKAIGFPTYAGLTTDQIAALPAL